MSFAKYPAYKGSGVEWLGAVPEHWEVSSLRHSLEEIFNGLTAEQIDPTETTVPVTRIETISNGTINFEKVGFVSKDDARSDRKLIFGDICFSNINSLKMIGNCAMYLGEQELYGGMNLLVLRPIQTRYPRYLYWVIRSDGFRKAVESYAKPAINQASISQSSLAGIGICIPHKEEQTAIATFLDHETAKIDALVAEQEKLINLLQEKRQAVISHAVTKGLNPNVPMKDSGVEWLGQVPAHWEIKNIRHILEAIGDVDHYMPASVDTGVPYLMTGDLKEVLSEVNLDDCKRVSYTDYLELSKRIRSSKGDVVMARYATIGTLMYVDIDVDFLVSYSCVTLKPDCAKISGLYLFHYMKSVAFLQSVENQINTNTQGNVGVKDLQSIKIAVPPVHEQVKISNFLKNEIIKFDALMTEAHTAITLLKEHRTALISAAVTGQIDVRNWSAQEGA